MRPIQSNIKQALLVCGSIFLLAPLGAQESTEELVNKLRGTAGATGASGEPKTRGINTRSLSAPAAPAAVTRSVLFSPRGIPKAIEAAAEENKVATTVTTAPSSSGAGDYSVSAGEKAVEVSYKVDPESKVSKDNILFQKGSTNFADATSFQVVQQLSQALKDPALAGLQFVIEGHASAEGSAYNNQILSQQRSEYIVSVLSSLGVDSKRLLPIGFGETQAQFPDHSDQQFLKQDRRVVIYRLNQ